VQESSLRGNHAKEGFLFLDSAREGSGDLSWLGQDPLGWIEGSLFCPEDLARLNRLLEETTVRFPLGAVAGGVTYEGEFAFAVYRWWQAWPAGTARENLLAATPGPTSLAMQPAWSPQRYTEAVDQTKEYIASGDIYQACITYPWQGNLEGDAWDLYLRLRQVSPAPYAAFWRGPKCSLLSTSPELFLEMRDRSICTRPIKGTRARPSQPGEEPAVAAELVGSEKERAELTMITDLERNDLGQICEFGSVHVPAFLQLESYAQVLHLVSTVQGTLRSSVTHPEALAACFPGGSITGAPKKRAREIIAEIEQAPRGFYTGALGFFSSQGHSQWSLLIRTIELQGSRATYGTGAGIVADSDPLREWEETLAKAKTLHFLG
jgi:para-aminobenzoate synthetase component 1